MSKSWKIIKVILTAFATVVLAVAVAFSIADWSHFEGMEDEH